jgi:hypothetical protein
MMRGLVSATIFVLWAGSALAQTVEVRAGEHDTFTRLVFRLPERLDYTLSQAGSVAELRFARQGLEFDTSVVFERVPRTRLAALDGTSDGDPLRLLLDCACDTRAFWYGESALVLDISDPAPSSEAPSPDTGVTSEARPARLRPLPLPAGGPSPAARLVADTLQDVPRPSLDTPVQDAALEAGRAQLIKQLGRAASQGLLTPLRRPPARSARTAQLPAPGSDAATHDPAPDKTDREAVERSADPSNVNLRAETSLDRAARPAMTNGLDPAGRQCPDPETVDVTRWTDGRAFPAQLGALRTDLLGEFDVPDQSAVMALARLYVHFGFGAEAGEVLAQMGERSPEAKALSAMAEILETGDAGPHLAALSGKMGCPPHAALWSALSRRKLPADQPMNAESILQGLSALPPHLRAHVGPMLAKRFLESGFERHGARVRRMLDRSDVTRTPEAELVGAEVAMSRGETQKAEDELEAVVTQNAEPSPAALLRLVESRVARGADISYETAQLTGAYALEHRGTPLGAALADAHLSALAFSGAFDEAFAGLAKRQADGGAAVRALRSELVAHLTKRAEDHDFLRLITAPRNARPEALDPAAATAAGRRLLSLGFLSEAARFARPEVPNGASRARQLLRAEIALNDGRPLEAERALVSLSGKEVDLLRARARSRAGDHDAARRIYTGLGRMEAARRQAWLAADWPALAEDADAPMADVARAILKAASRDEGTAGGVLARDRQRLEASGETRELVRKLFAARPEPERLERP